MDRVKKILATLIVMTLVASSVTVGAATPSVKKIKLTKKNTVVTVAKKYTYNGKKQTPKFKVVYKVGKKKIVLKKYNPKTKKGDYKINRVVKVRSAGKNSRLVIITGVGKYYSNVKLRLIIKVKKAKQKIKKVKIKGKKKLKAKKLKKKAVKVKLKVKRTGKGKLKFKRISKRLKVNKKGKVTVKKGTKKGVYKVKVKVKKTKRNYKASKWKKVKIRVK